MDRLCVRTRTSVKTSTSLVQFCFCLILVVLLSGCTEYRMDLEEFQAALVAVETGSDVPDGVSIDPAEVRRVIDAALGPYRVGPGDVLGVTITPAGKTSGLPLNTRLGSDGRVHLPMAGALEVDGMTLGEVETAIQNAYVPKYHVQAVVHVQLAVAETTEVMVVGALVTPIMGGGVSIPGMVSLRRSERNLLHATALAGGMSQAASGLVTLKRLRQPGKNVTFNLREPAGLRKALAIDPLEDGDIVMVHAARSNTVFVGGLVMGAGPQIYAADSEVTVLQALAAAGGGRPDLVPTTATLIRRVDGKDMHVKLDLVDLVRGKQENIVLASGDILWLPHTTGTRVHEFLNSAISFRATAGYYLGYSNVGSDLRGDEKDRDSTTVITGP